MNLSPRFRIALLAAALVAPMAAQAGDAFYLKGGSAQLTDDSQSLNGIVRTLDDRSTDTYGLLFEHRTHRDMAFGVEYLSYKNDFTPSGKSLPGAGKGDATTRTLQFVARLELQD